MVAVKHLVGRAFAVHEVRARQYRQRQTHDYERAQ